MGDSHIDKASQGMEKYFFRTSAENFNKIPGYPIAYWASNAIFRLFSEGHQITEFVNSRDGLTTGNNEIFIRFYFEVSRDSIVFGAETPTRFWQTKKLFAPLIKGGSYRKWYGNLINIITYDEASYVILSKSGNKLPSRENYFRENINWTRISTLTGSFRYAPAGCIFESASLCAYANDSSKLMFALAAANSCIAAPQLNIVNPTMNLLSGYFDMLRLPTSAVAHDEAIISNARVLVSGHQIDWDSYETSWDFTTLPLIAVARGQELGAHEKSSPQNLTPKSSSLTPKLSEAYAKLRSHWQDMTLEMQRLEEENNRIFIDAYGLQDELRPDVPLSEITLTCNPHYRYRLTGKWLEASDEKKEEELERRLLQDTMKELISYAVGCMFGRYSLDKPGLILANQGEGVDDYLQQVPDPSFPIDADNVIPILDGNWFSDDVVERFLEFLKLTFGEEHYTENIAFIENGLNINNRRNYSLRNYFIKEFYNDHVRSYKKRPIYWMFSSPKGSFNALIYIHRYRPDTVSVVLQYLRDFRAKISSQVQHLKQIEVSADASSGEKTRALKELDRYSKIITELDSYEAETLYPLATAQTKIDLDDGVKANYPLFGKALKKVSGL